VQVYDYGDGIRATCTFKDILGVIASPTAVAVKIKDPAGTVTTPAATNDATGVYHVDLTLNVEGKWHIRFEGTGTVIAAQEVQIKVRDSAFY
jgi:hypothetical protein